MSKLAFTTFGFSIGTLGMWAFMAYWNNPIHDWSTVIEDRCMYYEARSDARNQQARANLWEEISELSAVSYENQLHVNDMKDPRGFYMQDVVREAAETIYFADMIFEDFSPSIDLPEPRAINAHIDHDR